jgi:hypothetical protein
MIKLFKLLPQILLFTLLFNLPSALSQEVTIPDEAMDIDNFSQVKFERLKRMRKEIIQLESKIYVNNKKIEEDDDMVVRLKLEAENEGLTKTYNEKRILFIETLTGLSVLSHKETDLKNKKSFTEDLSAILEPALNGIKSISKRPREIQFLEENIAKLKVEVKNLEEAKKSLNSFSTDNKYKDFSRVIRKSNKKLDILIDDNKIKLEDYQFKLLKLEQNKGSFVGVFSTLIFDFLKTKGKNLFLSISALILILWFFSSIKNKVITFFVSKLIKFYGTSEQGLWFIRPIKVIYSVLGFILAFFVSITILYAMNDWVLVTLILFVLGALVWSSKQYLPVFFEQSKIVLNLGAIRENEVVIYEGVAWKLKSLGYYCRLENPLLTGGSLRISTKELLAFHSRPVQKNEPWFPTKTNDWVILDDKTFGKVTFQSPEQVVIRMLGGANKFLKLDQFLNLNPLNLSNGYGIEQIIGVDYGHQDLLLTNVVPNFKEKLQLYIKDFLKEEYKFVKEFQIEFNNTGASSLDIRFFIVCSGELAAKKRMLERRINMGFVEVCNEFNYVIPFSQMTVHMADKH